MTLLRSGTPRSPTPIIPGTGLLRSSLGPAVIGCLRGCPKPAGAEPMRTGIDLKTSSSTSISTNTAAVQVPFCT